MNSDGGSTKSSIFSTVCMNERLNLRLLDTASGKTQELSFYIGSGSVCAEYSKSMGRVDGRTINRDVLVAVCESERLKKILVSPAGSMKEISSDYISDNCKKAALDFNNRL